MSQTVNVVPLLIIIGDDEDQVKKVLQEIQNVKPKAIWPFRATILEGGMSVFSVKKRNNEVSQFGIVANIYEDNSCLLMQGNFTEETEGYFLVNCHDFLKNAENLLAFSEDRSIQTEVDF